MKSQSKSYGSSLRRKHSNATTRLADKSKFTGVRQWHGLVEDQAAAVRRWRRGQMLAAERSRELTAREGPRPAQAVAEALSAVAALDTMGIWPGPRDPVSEAAVLQVRRRWARIQQRAKLTQQR